MSENTMLFTTEEYKVVREYIESPEPYTTEGWLGVLPKLFHDEVKNVMSIEDDTEWRKSMSAFVDALISVGFGGLLYSFKGQKNTMEDVFGNNSLSPGDVISKLHAFIIEHDIRVVKLRS